MAVVGKSGEGTFLKLSHLACQSSEKKTNCLKTTI